MSLIQPAILVFADGTAVEMPRCQFGVAPDPADYYDSIFEHRRYTAPPQPPTVVTLTAFPHEGVTYTAYAKRPNADLHHKVQRLVVTGQYRRPWWKRWAR